MCVYKKKTCLDLGIHFDVFNKTYSFKTVVSSGGISDLGLHRPLWFGSKKSLFQKYYNFCSCQRYPPTPPNHLCRLLVLWKFRTIEVQHVVDMLEFSLCIWPKHTNQLIFSFIEPNPLMRQFGFPELKRKLSYCWYSLFLTLVCARYNARRLYDCRSEVWHVRPSADIIVPVHREMAHSYAHFFIHQDMNHIWLYGS